MAKRRKWFAAGGLFLCIGILGAALLTPVKEPVYNGKSLRYWLEMARLRQDFRLLSSAPVPPPDAELAPEALAHIGTNALPWMVAQLERTPRPWQVNLRRLTARIRRPWNVKGIDFLCGDGGHLAGLIMTGFEHLGTNAIPAVPELTKLALQTNDYYLSVIAMNALNEMGKPAVPSLLLVMNSPGHPKRGLAALFIARTQPQPDLDTLAAIFALVRDPDPNVSDAGRRALMSLGYVDTTETEEALGTPSAGEMKSEPTK